MHSQYPCQRLNLTKPPTDWGPKIPNPYKHQVINHQRTSKDKHFFILWTRYYNIKYYFYNMQKQSYYKSHIYNININI